MIMKCHKNNKKQIMKCLETPGNGQELLGNTETQLRNTCSKIPQNIDEMPHNAWKHLENSQEMLHMG